MAPGKQERNKIWATMCCLSISKLEFKQEMTRHTGINGTIQLFSPSQSQCMHTDHPHLISSQSHHTHSGVWACFRHAERENVTLGWKDREKGARSKAHQKYRWTSLHKNERVYIQAPNLIIIRFWASDLIEMNQTNLRALYYQTDFCWISTHHKITVRIHIPK